MLARKESTVVNNNNDIAKWKMAISPHIPADINIDEVWLGAYDESPVNLEYVSDWLFDVVLPMANKDVFRAKSRSYEYYEDIFYNSAYDGDSLTHHIIRNVMLFLLHGKSYYAAAVAIVLSASKDNSSKFWHDVDPRIVIERINNTVN